jgi:hypothetical protein
MSRMITKAGMPQQRLATTPWSDRLTAVLALGVVVVAVGFAYPSAGMSTIFVDESVPQIVTVNGP